MVELMKKVREIADTYDGFEAAVITYCGKKEIRKEKVMDFMKKNPNALSSDILAYIIKQPDFKEDSVVYGKKVG